MKTFSVKHLSEKLYIDKNYSSESIVLHKLNGLVHGGVVLVKEQKLQGTHEPWSNSRDLDAEKDQLNQRFQLQHQSFNKNL